MEQNFGIEVNYGNNIGYLGSPRYGIFNPVGQRTALQELLRYTDVLWFPEKADGFKAGINSPFTNPMIDLTEPPQIGVMWTKNADPTLKKAYQGSASQYYPYNKISEVTDSYGNKFVRIPKFYIAKQDGNGNKGWFISEVKRDGYYLPWCFWDFANNSELAYVDIGKHIASESSDTTKLESKPNKYPLVNKTIVQFRSLAQANGVGYQQHDIHTVDILQTLFYTEFATLNSQSIMQGYTTGQYSASHTATASGTGVNQVVLANANADLYRVGQTIGVGTSLGGQQIASNRVITAINVVDGSNKALVFDGAPVNIAIGNVVYNTGYKTGWSAELQTGWAVANDGKSPMAFYGIESLFGDVWQWVDGLNINEGQGWVCKNAAQYASNLFAAPYEQLSYTTGLTEGYATAMGHDPDRPYAAVTSAVGGSSTTFYSDYYYRSAGQRVALLGGRWVNGVDAGLSYWHLNGSSGDANVTFGGRLVRKPQKAESDAWALANGINLNQPSYKSVPANLLLENFGATPASGYVTETAPNGKSVVGLKAEGTDDYGILPSNAPNPTSGNFAFGFIVKTGANKVKYWWVRNNTSDANTQYGFKQDASGNLFVILEGTSIQIGTALSVGYHLVWLERISDTLKAEINRVQTLSQAHAVTLTSRSRVRFFVSATGDTTGTGFSNDTLFTAVYDDTDIPKTKSNLYKLAQSAYGL